MKSRSQRLPLIAAAVVVAVAAFIILRPSGDEDGRATEPPPQPAPSVQSGAPEGAPARAPDSTGPAEGNELTRIDVRSGQPVGGVARIEVERGETVRLEVVSDAPDELHVHGYDEFVDVTPAEPARISFPAEFEGIFEVELEGAGIQVATLEVTP